MEMMGEQQKVKSTALDSLVKKRSMPEIFSLSGCAMCVFFGDKQTPVFKCDECGGDTKYYCEKHVGKVPEHNEGNEFFHKPEFIFPDSTLKQDEFDDLVDKNIDDIELLTDCMIEELNIEKCKMIKSVHDRAAKMSREFTRQMTIQESVVKAILLRNMKDRLMTIEAEQNIFEKHKKTVNDFRNGVIMDEEEFMIGAREAQNCIRNHDFKISPILHLDSPADGVFFTAFGATPKPFTWVKADAVNVHWRDLSSQKMLYIEPTDVPDWNLRDLPLITLEHPDRQRLGIAMINSIHLRARILIEAGFIRPFYKMDQIEDLLDLALETRKTSIVIYRNEDDGSLHRMALRHLTNSFNDSRGPLALQICFIQNDPHLKIKDLVHLIKKRFNIDFLSYEILENYLGKYLNGIVIFPQNEHELRYIRKSFSNNPCCFSDDGFSRIDVMSKSNIILTDLDDPENEPVVVTEALLEEGCVLNCPPEIEVSREKPAMVVECWFDAKHPSGRAENDRNPNYDPFMKQMSLMSTFIDLRAMMIKNRKQLKIALNKPVDYDRMPWVWLCSTKIKGKSLEEEVEGMWVKRSWGMPVFDQEIRDPISLD